MLVITENNACFVPTTSPVWLGSPMFPQHCCCWQALSWEDEGQKVLQDNFLETKPNFFEEHCARTTHSMESCDIRWHASFVIKGIDAMGERKTKSSSYPVHRYLMILCVTNMPRDRMNGNVVFSAFFHLSLNYISSHAVYHRWCTNFPMCKIGIPGIFHKTDSLRHGVFRRVLAQSIQIPGHPSSVTQNTLNNNMQLS